MLIVSYPLNGITHTSVQVASDTIGNGVPAGAGSQPEPGSRHLHQAAAYLRYKVGNPTLWLSWLHKFGT